MMMMMLRIYDDVSMMRDERFWKIKSISHKLIFFFFFLENDEKEKEKQNDETKTYLY